MPAGGALLTRLALSYYYYYYYNNIISVGHLDVLPEERLVPPGLGVGELLELVHSRLGGPEPWTSSYIFTIVTLFSYV